MKRRNWLAGWVGIVGLLGGLYGCDQGAQTTTQPGDADIETTEEDLAKVREFVQQDQSEQPALPAGHPPIGGEGMGGNGMPGMGGMAGMGMSPPSTAGGELRYAAPAEWESEEPAMRMRVAQYRLPGAGESGPGQLLVYDTRIGGGVEVNIQRWRSQFFEDDMSPVSDDAVTREELAVGDLKVHYVEMLGNYRGSPMSMQGGRPDTEAGQRLLGAIVETPDGEWFFKATGPDATMQAQRAAFRAFLDTIEYEAE